jgi:glyoxylase-like metal-dependent hydrolase (beta-lactamase superfamily II)
MGYMEARHHVDIQLFNMDEIEIGDEVIIVMHTPGHSVDSVCLLFGKHLVCGDLVFAGGSTGRVDLEGSDGMQLKRSLGKLFKLDEEIVVYPGHNYGGKKTSIEKIKKMLLDY